MIGSGIPKPFMKTREQKIVSPAAMRSVGRQRKCVLAQALMITSNGKATANPAPRTRNPNTKTDALTKVSPLNANAPIGVPGVMKDRMSEIAPIEIRMVLRTVGK